jgi:hypothetical protein
MSKKGKCIVIKKKEKEKRKKQIQIQHCMKYSKSQYESNVILFQYQAIAISLKRMDGN